MKNHSSLLKVLNSENDGKKLLSRLSEIALKQSKEDFEKDLIETFQGIHGPWAFIYWQVSGQKGYSLLTYIIMIMFTKVCCTF